MRLMLRAIGKSRERVITQLGSRVGADADIGSLDRQRGDLFKGEVTGSNPIRATSPA